MCVETSKKSVKTEHKEEGNRKTEIGKESLDYFSNFGNSKHFHFPIGL